jgi:IclR family pca regulon transcriptional regulator
LAVLEAFDTERQRLNATLASQRTGITRASARRHLLTLAELGYLETDGSHYWLSARVLRLAGSYMATSRLPRTLQPTLNRLAAQTQAAFSAVVLDGDECVIVARSAGVAEPVRHLAYGLHLGARLPAHATSTGQVLLANLPKADFMAWLKGRELARITPQTEVGVTKFKGLIEKVRQADHALARDGHELGIHALAVPLRNMQGRALAALLAGEAWRWTVTRAPDALNRTLELFSGMRALNEATGIRGLIARAAVGPTFVPAPSGGDWHKSAALPGWSLSMACCVVICRRCRRGHYRMRKRCWAGSPPPSMDSSRSTSLSCFPRVCAPRVRASASTSAASSRRSARCSL